MHINLNIKPKKHSSFFGFIYILGGKIFDGIY